MPEEKERPRPHGDPLRDEIADSREENRGQQQGDAPSDPLTDAVPAPDDADGAKRRKQYKNGATSVSGID